MHGAIWQLRHTCSLVMLIVQGVLILGVQTLTGCGPACRGTSGSCLSLRVEGPAPPAGDSLSARLTVWLGGSDLAGAPISVVSRKTEEQASLPMNLLIQPPPSMSRVDRVSVQLLGGMDAGAPLPSDRLLLTGRTGLSWPSGAQIEAAVDLAPPKVPYSHRVDLAAGGAPRSFVVLDADHNGQMDLAVRNGGASGDSIFLLLANADGSFQPAQNIFPRIAGRALSDLAAADLDRDHHADLAFADAGTGAVYVLYGKGDGSFSSPVMFPLQANTPAALHAADLDADGWVDLLIAGKLGTLAVFWNEGRGLFESKTVLMEGSTTASPLPLGSPAVADINRDGRLDVLGAGKLWLNGSGRTFFPLVTLDTKANPPFAIAVQDFDGDTWADLLTTDASGGGKLSFLKGDGTGHVVAGYTQALGSHPLLAVSADLNSDLIPDLALTDQSRVLFALGNGRGGFEPAACPGLGTGTICQLPGNAVFARAQDLDGDGVPELLFVTESPPGRLGTLSILRSGPMAAYRPLIDESSPSVLRDNFTLGGPRIAGLYEDKNGAFIIEQSLSQLTWMPAASFVFVTPQFCEEPPRVQAAAGNIGAAGGMIQTANRDFSVPFTDTTGNFVVQADAILPEDRLDLSSLPNAGAPIATANSLSVLLRREVNYYAAPSIGISNGLIETATGCMTGISDSNWHNFAVNFNKSMNRLFVYVDGRLNCALDLNSFAGGIYRTYSSAAVGMGGNRGVIYLDNFQAGPAY